MPLRSSGYAPSVQSNTYANQRVAIYGDNTTATVSAMTDTVNQATSGLYVGSALMGYTEGADKMERYRLVTQKTLLASAARTGTTSSADQTNRSFKGLYVYLDVTVNPGGGETLTVDVEAKDDVNDEYHVIATSGAQALGGSAGQYVIAIYPADLTVANGIDAIGEVPLSAVYRVNVTHSSGGTWSYSVIMDGLI